MRNSRFAAVAATAICTLAATTANAATTLFTNLGPGDSYGGSAYGFGGDLAFSFTAASSGSVSQIDVALAKLTPAATDIVSLWSSTNGLLDTQLDAWTVSVLFDLSSAESGELTTISGITGLDLTGGATYFLRVMQVSGTTDWKLNSTDFSSIAVESTGLHQPDTLTGAFDILGADASVAAPEPSAWALMLVGFGGLGAALRRRRTAAALAA